MGFSPMIELLISEHDQEHAAGLSPPVLDTSNNVFGKTFLNMFDCRVARFKLAETCKLVQNFSFDLLISPHSLQE